MAIWLNCSPNLTLLTTTRMRRVRRRVTSSQWIKLTLNSSPQLFCYFCTQICTPFRLVSTCTSCVVSNAQSVVRSTWVRVQAASIIGSFTLKPQFGSFLLQNAETGRWRYGTYNSYLLLDLSEIEIFCCSMTAVSTSKKKKLKTKNVWISISLLKSKYQQCCSMYLISWWHPL